MNATKTTVSEREFCLAVGISRVTAWRLRQRRKLAHCRIGKRILYTQTHVDDFLKAHECPAKQSRSVR